MRELKKDVHGSVIQGFNPGADKTINDTVVAAGSKTIDVCDDLAVLIYADGDLSLSLDGKPGVFPLPAGQQFGFVCVDIASITLANSGASSVNLYILRQ